MTTLLGISISVIGLALAWDSLQQGHVGAALIFGAATCTAALALIVGTGDRND